MILMMSCQKLLGLCVFLPIECLEAREVVQEIMEQAAEEVGYKPPKFAFDLQISFNLSRDEIASLMDTAHTYELLMSYPETEGACATISKWMAEGHELEIVTGRPISTHEGSLEWLSRRGIEGLPIIHVDKFGREPPPLSPDAPRSLSVDEFCERQYDFAVEDSPMAFAHLARLDDCRVAVYERPWNKTIELPSKAFTCCSNWQEIDNLFQRYSSLK